MATVGRPIREGFDYFPLNTDFFKDRHVRRLVKKFGTDGVAVLIYLWCECYGDKGYYLNLDEPLAEDVADDLMLEEEKVSEIIEYLIEKKWFVRRTSSAGESVLTSTGIQKRYLTIRNQIRRKLSGIVDPMIWLIDEIQEAISSEINDISSEKKAITSEENGIISETNGISSVFSQNSSAFSHISSDEQKRTEENRTEVNKREQKKTEVTEEVPWEKAPWETDSDSSDSSDPSDSFHSSFSDGYSDDLITRLKGAGVDIKQNTLRLINRWIADYDRRSIDEAVDTAIQKKARNIVGYTDTVLRKWSLGDGCPKWVEQEEMTCSEQKKEYMKPGALGKILVNGHEALGT